MNTSLRHLFRSALTSTTRTKHKPRGQRTLNLESLENRIVFSIFDGTVDTGISGTLYNDANSNGQRDSKEKGLSAWTVYLDLNKNGARDLDTDGALEPAFQTDASGDYSIPFLIPGVYRLAEVMKSGFGNSNPTLPFQDVAVRNTHFTKADFFNSPVTAPPPSGSVSGSLWNDLNGDGVRDVGETGLVGWSIYVDLNSNSIQDAGEPGTLTDASGNYRITGLTAGSYRVAESPLAGWSLSPSRSTAYAVNVFSGSNTVVPDFANFVVKTGSVSGSVFNDLNSDGVRNRDATSGLFTEAGLAGWTVFADLNGNSVRETGEVAATTDANGQYTLDGLSAGSFQIVELIDPDFKPTQPLTGTRPVSLKNGQILTGIDFGDIERREAGIYGVVYSDSNKDSSRGNGERGLAGITMYIDLNDNGVLDAGEPTTVTSDDLFYTPTIDESGSYSFTHLSKGTYKIREVVPEKLSDTPEHEREHIITVGPLDVVRGLDNGNRYRPNEIHGLKFEDINGNHSRDVDEPGLGGVTIYIDLDRSGGYDAGEPMTITAADGTYKFDNMTPGAYIVREIVTQGFIQTYPVTQGGILWPAGTSNAASGNVTPTDITTSLANNEHYASHVSLTLPETGALTNMVDVFLLFDDTGSFTANSPIVRSAFPEIIAQLQAALPGTDLGFGVGRFEEYGSFASEFSTGRPFVLNQPIVASSTTGFSASIQSALDRTTPGYGGDTPETVFEALYQTVSGAGFDGDNDGSILGSGAAGLASTQLNPGASGDVPSFASFTPDVASGVLPGSGNVGGAGFRRGALPIILTATDTGFAYQPQGESQVIGLNGLSLPVSQLTQASRGSTPFNSGAGIQQTITGLNALGALVIGLGVNDEPGIDPRQGLEAVSALTGATNRSANTIDNGTPDPIAPGDPFYFKIASGFGASVANGVVSAIQNAATNVAVNITLKASDPRVKIINHTGTILNVGSGQTAGFDIEFVGDGRPHRFDLQFVREGTNVVLGSIPVVIGTPVAGDGYEYEDLDDGDIEDHVDFGNHRDTIFEANHAPGFTAGSSITLEEDVPAQSIPGWATNISAGAATESSQLLNFIVTNDNPSLFSAQPSITADGTLSFTPAMNASGTATVSVRLHDNGGIFGGGVDTSDVQLFTIALTPVNDAPVAVGDTLSGVEDTSFTFTLSNLQANDFDVDSPALSLSITSPPVHGQLLLNGDGTATYTPDANFNGVDAFTYLLSDGLLDSVPATVTINVSGVNDAPVALADSLSAVEDTPLVITQSTLLGNDRDPDSPALSVVIKTIPARGTLAAQADGSFLYTPNLNFTGVDTFTYAASDGALQSNIVSVTVNVAAVNDAPLAKNDAYSLLDGNTLTITTGVLANDTDVEGDVLTAQLVSGPSHGTLTLSANGSLVYTPATGWIGTDSFVYRAFDGQIAGNNATVTIESGLSSSGLKFMVVTDGASVDSRYDYSGAGALLNSHSLTTANSAPRGVATNKDGSVVWIIDSKGTVFVEDRLGNSLGSWTAKGLGKPEGIATDGTNIWIVDSNRLQVSYYANAASARTGGLNATSQIKLNTNNKLPKDITTDGVHLWVVDDTATTDRIFRYSTSGVLEGSWTIDASNTTPTGLTIDPNNVSNVWVVDAGTLKVYQYDTAASRTSGAQSASGSFPLGPGVTNPQGIADPMIGALLNDSSSKPATAAPSSASASSASAIAPMIASPSTPASPSTSTSPSMSSSASDDYFAAIQANDSASVSTATASDHRYMDSLVTGHTASLNRFGSALSTVDHDQAFAQLTDFDNTLHLPSKPTARRR